MGYAYDGFGRLTERSAGTDPAAATRYLYASGQPYADATADGAITARYLFGPDGQPLARLMSGSSTPDFYLTDRQDSVLQIVDSAGNTLKRVWYSGLGVPDNKRAGTAASDRFELGGQTHDQNSQLSLLGGRWYDPKLGRYLTEGGPGIGLNPYPVAENDAPNAIWPSAPAGGEPESDPNRARAKRNGWVNLYDTIDGFFEPVRMGADVIRTFQYLGGEALGWNADGHLPDYRSKMAKGWLDAEMNGYKDRAPGMDSFDAYWSDTGSEMGEGIVKPWKPLVEGWNKWGTPHDPDGQSFYNAVGGTLWFFLPGPKGVPKGAGAVVRTAGVAAPSRLATLAGAVGRTAADAALSLTLVPAYTTFARHLYKHLEQWFTFVFDPSVEPTNWAAEQAIRPAVVNRKVWGGNRNRTGADAQGILSTRPVGHVLDGRVIFGVGPFHPR